VYEGKKGRNFDLTEEKNSDAVLQILKGCKLEPLT